MELVQHFSKLFHEAMNLLNCESPNIEPNATGHITEQISMIENIIEKGYAYVSNGSVYFDIIKYNENYKYGQLSGRIIEEQYETTRELDGQDEKRNKADFALWKKAPDAHLMRWVSPWGEGFPGWHIECSAMSAKYLGTEFDIHGGGMDLQFPHHESEIAQSTIAHGHAPAKYWMHNNMITIEGKKMGKSYNNVIKLLDLFSGEDPNLDQPYHPMVVRFYILQTHYRSTLDFSNVALQAAEKALKRLWDAYETLLEISYTNLSRKDYPKMDIEAFEDTEMYHEMELVKFDIDKQVRKLSEECEEFMDDDFNTPKVIANLFELAPIINRINTGDIKISNSTLKILKETYNHYVEYILGLKAIGKETKHDDKTEKVLKIVLDLRNNFRKRKDFTTSDEIRDRLSELGILLKDEKDGSVSYLIS